MHVSEVVTGDEVGVRSIADAVRAAPPRLGDVRLVAVDGPSGAGKSTLADALVDEFARRGVDVRLVRADDFATWDQPVEWWPRLVDGVLEPLRHHRRGRYRRVEWPGGEPVPGSMVEVDVPAVLVLEGVSAARRSASGSLSVAVWVSLPDESLRLDRAVAREGEGARPHLVRWQEFEREWFRADATRSRADFCVKSPVGAKSYW